MRTLFAALALVTFAASAALACDHDPNAQQNTTSTTDQSKKKTADAKNDKDKKAPASKDQPKS